ncbi:putative Hemopexin-like domain-containing protein [Rosa chinensis]|uniref:Putative Hemopexin-like domain-containing protein n=2 Tax=Rosa chinensis TaxID=74649 RepID=A0A2P6QLN9_ROSCH|nr:putative Hemopexin-like domain-containing protein [Rosa chinensis]
MGIYPSRAKPLHAEHGIDCAFGSHDGDEAFLFSGNLCAPINYSPGTLKGLITKPLMTITAMFPFLKKREFKSSIDAAFESTRKYEAYLFKDDRYALINYGSELLIIPASSTSSSWLTASPV